MTSEERLAIAEEIFAIYAAKHASYSLKDLEVYDTSGVWYAIRQMSPYDGIVYGASRDIIETIHQARQKIAAEREAAMSPNERKYKAALEEIVRRHDGNDNLNVTCSVAMKIASEALKEST